MSMSIHIYLLHTALNWTGLNTDSIGYNDVTVLNERKAHLTPCSFSFSAKQLSLQEHVLAMHASNIYLLPIYAFIFQIMVLMIVYTQPFLLNSCKPYDFSPAFRLANWSLTNSKHFKVRWTWNAEKKFCLRAEIFF